MATPKKLITLDMAQELAKQLDNRNKQLIAAEADRASAAESELSSEIARVEEMLGGKSIVYITQAEYDALDEIDQLNEKIAYVITDFNDNHTHEGLYYTIEEVNTFLNGKSDVGHNHDDLYANKTEDVLTDQDISDIIAGLDA